MVSSRVSKLLVVKTTEEAACDTSVPEPIDTLTSAASSA